MWNYFMCNLFRHIMFSFHLPQNATFLFPFSSWWNSNNAVIMLLIWQFIMSTYIRLFTQFHCQWQCMWVEHRIRLYMTTNTSVFDGYFKFCPRSCLPLIHESITFWMAFNHWFIQGVYWFIPLLQPMGIHKIYHIPST